MVRHSRDFDVIATACEMGPRASRDLARVSPAASRTGGRSARVRRVRGRNCHRCGFLGRPWATGTGRAGACCSGAALTGGGGIGGRGGGACGGGGMGGWTGISGGGAGGAGAGGDGCAGVGGGDVGCATACAGGGATSGGGCGAAGARYACSKGPRPVGVFQTSMLGAGLAGAMGSMGAIGEGGRGVGSTTGSACVPGSVGWPAGSIGWGTRVGD